MPVARLNMAPAYNATVISRRQQRFERQEAPVHASVLNSRSARLERTLKNVEHRFNSVKDVDTKKVVLKKQSKSKKALPSASRPTRSQRQDQSQSTETPINVASSVACIAPVSNVEVSSDEIDEWVAAYVAAASKVAVEEAVEYEIECMAKQITTDILTAALLDTEHVASIPLMDIHSEMKTVDLEMEAAFDVTKHSWRGLKARKFFVTDATIETRTHCGSVTNSWALEDVFDVCSLHEVGSNFFFSMKVINKACWTSAATLTFSVPDENQRDSILRKLRNA
ncbi:hypothetical protein AB1Y20_014964 [Prymnesium parvum]|uniref:VASt domain-containing protein n=1 Tax=Prymnesium parvum TaxID=97485 RepID=A0AB34JVE1_PRYPA